MSRWVDRASLALARTRLPERLPAHGPLIVMYHGLGGPDGVSPADFAAQLELLGSRRRVVSLAEIGERLGDQSASDLAAITFDDGYVDFATLALPALRAAGLHATLFVPAGHIGGSNVWDTGVFAERRILDAGALRNLDQAHVEIGGHGYSHCRLAGLARAALLRETTGCRATLEQAIERPVRLFAYPYGQLDDFDRSAQRAVAEAGFSLACSTWFGRSSRPSQRFSLRRVGIEPMDDLQVVEAKLDGAYDWIAWKERLGYLKRSIIGSARKIGA